MYQTESRTKNSVSDRAPAQPAAALADAAASLLSEEGFSAVSARAIARRAGVRPSAVNYWFGGSDKLVEHALGISLDRYRAELDRLATAFDAIAPGPAGAASVLLSASHRLNGELRLGTLLAWSVAMEAQGAGRQMDAARAFSAARSDVWRKLGRLGGLRDVAADAVGGVMEWMSRGALFTASPAIFDCFRHDVVRRVLERASGTSPTSPGDSRWRIGLASTGAISSRVAEGEIRESRFGETGSAEAQFGKEPTPAKTAIIETAVRLLVERGPEALTHRAIASASGVSLSSMTYHFSSIGEIAQATYQRLYERARARARVLVEAPQGLRIEDIFIPGPGDQLGAEFVAMQQLFLAAARDESLRRFADGAFAQMGAGSTLILSALTDARPDLDRLDGFIWRVCITSLIEHTASNPGAKTKSGLQSSIAAATRALFC